jgi:hypothetical protein
VVVAAVDEAEVVVGVEVDNETIAIIGLATTRLRSQTKSLSHTITLLLAFRKKKNQNSGQL